VFPLRYELGFCIPEDDNLHSHRCDNLRSYISSGKFNKWSINPRVFAMTYFVSCDVCTDRLNILYLKLVFHISIEGT
jgi:carbamate kinase